MRLSTMELATKINDATSNWCGIHMAIQIIRLIEDEARLGRLPKDLERAMDTGKETAHAARQKARG